MVYSYVSIQISLNVTKDRYCTEPTYPSEGKSDEIILNLSPSTTIEQVSSSNFAHHRFFQSHPCRTCFVFPNAMNQASEACQLIRIAQNNPEVQSITACAEWVRTGARGKRAQRRQISRLPQRDTVAIKV